MMRGLSAWMFSVPSLLFSQGHAVPILKFESVSISQAQDEIIVAVIDTGVDVNHPFLRKYIWNNPGEKVINSRLPSSAGDSINNGKDDDGNGYADDFHGWNFSANSNQVRDQNGHGTHVAGLILQNAGKYKERIRILPIKYYDAENSQSANLKNTINAFEYAVKMGAKIINYSAGGFQSSDAEREIIRWAGSKGVLLVAAAGNEAMDTDVMGFYPASYDLKNVISVAAVNKDGNILASSNYGSHSVQFAAPGERLLSTLPNNSWGIMTGTSQATAVVSGKLVQVYAKLMSEGMTDKKILAEKSLELLRREGRASPQLITKTKFAKRIEALEM